MISSDSNQVIESLSSETRCYSERGHFSWLLELGCSCHPPHTHTTPTQAVDPVCAPFTMSLKNQITNCAWEILPLGTHHLSRKITELQPSLSDFRGFVCSENIKEYRTGGSHKLEETRKNTNRISVGPWIGPQRRNRTPGRDWGDPRRALLVLWPC